MGYPLNHLVAMVTNKKTGLSHSVYQNCHRNIMECDTDESHFLNLESEDLDLIYIPNARVNCLKIIPFTAAHTYMAPIWQYPPGAPTPTAVQAIIFDDNKRNLVWPHFPTTFLESYCLSDNDISLQSE